MSHSWLKLFLDLFTGEVALYLKAWKYFMPPVHEGVVGPHVAQRPLIVALSAVLPSLRACLSIGGPLFNLGISILLRL
jgi:hypothetical protein